MKPSQTSIGSAWLSNFDASSRRAAEILVDSLRFASLSQIWIGLRAELERLVASGQLRAPVLVLAERSLDHYEPGDPNPLGLKPLPESPVAFVDFDPGRPTQVAAGSDAFVDMVSREVRKANDARWLPPESTIDDLRKARCRSIVVVTDYSGSGDQLLDITRSLVRNGTLRSWRSLGWLDIGVLAYAASRRAIGRLEKARSVDQVWSCEVAPSFSDAPWDSAAREAIEELCVVECRYGSELALGYRKSSGLFLSERSAPDNMPAVLIQEASGWIPLFPSRQVPSSFVREIHNYTVDRLPADLMRQVGQTRLARVAEARPMRRPWGEMTAALAVAATRPVSGVSSLELSATLGVDIRVGRTIHDALQRLGLVDERGRVTASGEKELTERRLGRRQNTAGSVSVQTVYYPPAQRSGADDSA